MPGLLESARSPAPRARARRHARANRWTSSRDGQSVRRLRLGVGLVLGIDAAREQALERVVDAGPAERLFTSVLTLNAGRWPS